MGLKELCRLEIWRRVFVAAAASPKPTMRVELMLEPFIKALKKGLPTLLKRADIAGQVGMYMFSTLMQMSAISILRSWN